MRSVLYSISNIEITYNIRTKESYNSFTFTLETAHHSHAKAQEVQAMSDAT